MTKIEKEAACEVFVGLVLIILCPVFGWGCYWALDIFTPPFIAAMSSFLISGLIGFWGLGWILMGCNKL